MKIDCDLTREESSVLAMALGIAMGEFRLSEATKSAVTCVSLMNKLFANSPEYRAYDEQGVKELFEKGQA